MTVFLQILKYLDRFFPSFLPVTQIGLRWELLLSGFELKFRRFCNLQSSFRTTISLLKHVPNLSQHGQCCGSVGRAVASEPRDPRFESRYRQTFIKHLFTVNYVEKTKKKKKRGREWPIFQKNFSQHHR